VRRREPRWSQRGIEKAVGAVVDDLKKQSTEISGRKTSPGSPPLVG